MSVTATQTISPVGHPAPLTVLIVDDEDSMRTLCRDVVTDSGLRARTASTTEQALDALEQFSIDIVITDLRVPQLGGIGLLRKIKELSPPDRGDRFDAVRND
jgi:DNA-binding NtrC family response regulator